MDYWMEENKVTMVVLFILFLLDVFLFIQIWF